MKKVVKVVKTVQCADIIYGEIGGEKLSFGLVVSISPTLLF